jgi:hypothetical protein
MGLRNRAVKFELRHIRQATTAIFLILSLGLSVITLTSCNPHTVKTPSVALLQSSLKNLIAHFESKHLALVNWNHKLVQQQIENKLPDGIATEAGWLLSWTSVQAGEISEATIPWALLGGTPNNLNHPTINPEFNQQPSQTIQDQITRLVQMREMQADPELAAVIQIRQSKKYPQWVAFNTVPYLPFTDPAYGIATINKGTWELVDFGTANVGCDQVPHNVETGFGFSC